MENSTITVHPLAESILFSHYRDIRKVFYDVLGQLEIDYLCIALLTIKNELLFFSSSPSIEQNMLKHHACLFDSRFQYDFFKQEQVQFWSSKTKLTEFGIGLSVPSVFNEYRVIYSFASKSIDQKVHNHFANNIAMFVQIGKFCLKKIMAEIPSLNDPTQLKPVLKLIINNRV